MADRTAGFPKTLGRITVYSWGVDLRCFGGYVVARWRAGASGRGLYWSPNGTPWHENARGLGVW